MVTPVQTSRPQGIFLQSPYPFGKNHSCTHEVFLATCQSRRVGQLLQMRQQPDMDTESYEFKALLANQPLFCFTRTRRDGTFIWNGLLLFSFHDADYTRQTLDLYHRELNVILTFSEPDFERQYFLIDSGLRPDSIPADPAQADTLLYETRTRIMRQLHEYFPRVTWFKPLFCIRALPIDAYTIYQPELLFGKPTLQTETEANLPAVEVTLFSRIRNLFSSLIPNP